MGKYQVTFSVPLIGTKTIEVEGSFQEVYGLWEEKVYKFVKDSKVAYEYENEVELDFRKIIADFQKEFDERYYIITRLEKPIIMFEDKREESLKALVYYARSVAGNKEWDIMRAFFEMKEL